MNNTGSIHSAAGRFLKNHKGYIEMCEISNRIENEAQNQPNENIEIHANSTGEEIETADKPEKDGCLKLAGIVFFLCIYLSMSSAFASVFCRHTIKVNSNFSIYIEFQDLLKSEVTTGLYFDLTVWAKNAENELTNVNGRVDIDYLRYGESILMWVSKSDTAETAYSFLYDADREGVRIIRYGNVNTGYIRDFIIQEEYFLKETKELTKAIITGLNTDFKTNKNSESLHSIELFVKNNKEDIALSKCRQGGIHSDYIYINREDAVKSIEGQPDFFIETIQINRKEVDDIVEVDSDGCG